MNIFSFGISCRSSIILIAMAAALTLMSLAWANPASTTKFTNIGSIVYTRHNLTQQPSTIDVAWMGGSRNDYGEVCVYCHTPHGSQTLVNMPLWNRTVKSTTYTTYNSFSLTQGTAPQPGNNSLTCLTCHDGQTAIDSIINMPGSGRGQASQAATQDDNFLSTWPIGPVQWGMYGGHGTLSNSPATLNEYGQCMSCHSPLGDQWGSAAPNFDTFFIGTDLTNDHPIGITFSAASGVGGFNQPTGVAGTARYFDTNANGHMDTNEVRLYNTGGVVRVECASCHDPHGVPSAGPGTQFKPTFLRVANGSTTGSALCLTCHDK